MRPIKFPLANWISGGKWQLLVGRCSDVKALFSSGCATVTALSPRLEVSRTITMHCAVKIHWWISPLCYSEGTDRCIRGGRSAGFMMHFHFSFARANTGLSLCHCGFISLVWSLKQSSLGLWIATQAVFNECVWEVCCVSSLTPLDPVSITMSIMGLFALLGLLSSQPIKQHQSHWIYIYFKKKHIYIYAAQHHYCQRESLRALLAPFTRI